GLLRLQVFERLLALLELGLLGLVGRGHALELFDLLLLGGQALLVGQTLFLFGGETLLLLGLHLLALGFEALVFFFLLLLLGGEALLLFVGFLGVVGVL